MSVQEIRTDAIGLAKIFGSLVQNPKTGMGTGRDKSQYTEINPYVRSLSEMELSGLYRKSGIIQRAVGTYPMDAYQGWVDIDLGSSNISSEDVEEYFDRLNLRDVIYEAALYSRWHGDGFVLVGVADGKDTSEEVDEDNIYSLRWLKCVTRYQLRPEIKANALNKSKPTYYRLNLGGEDMEEIRAGGGGDRWHHSRVLRIPGVLLDSYGLGQTDGYNDSIIQSMFESFCAYMPGMQAASIMVQDHRVRKYGIKGLANLISGQAIAGVATNQNGKDAMTGLMERMMANDLARSVARSEVFDPDTETIDNLTNSYNGVEGVIEKLLEAWAMDTDMSRPILYNLLGSNGLTSGEAFKFARLDHAYRLNSWMKAKLRQPLRQIYKLGMLAQDSFAKGTIIEGWALNIPLLYEPTQEELLEMQLKCGQRDGTYIGLGVYSAEEARKQFTQAKFNPAIVLDPNEISPAKKAELEEEEQKQLQLEQGIIPGVEEETQA